MHQKYCKDIFTKVSFWNIMYVKISLHKGDKVSVQNRIKELRIQRNITQIQMAKDLQVTRQTVVAIENNHYNPSLELALKLARYFNLKVEDIFTLE